MYRLQYHIVWTPRYRRNIFVQGVKQYLEKTISKLHNLDDDIEVQQVNVQVDRVHLVMVIPPRIAIADVVQFMKSRTGKILKEKFGYLTKTIKNRGGIWSRGYCVSSIGLNESAIRAYVQHQEKIDKAQLELDL